MGMGMDVGNVKLELCYPKNIPHLVRKLPRTRCRLVSIRTCKLVRCPKGELHFPAGQDFGAIRNWLWSEMTHVHHKYNKLAMACTGQGSEYDCLRSLISCEYQSIQEHALREVP